MHLHPVAAVTSTAHAAAHAVREAATLVAEIAHEDLVRCWCHLRDHDPTPIHAPSGVVHTFCRRCGAHAQRGSDGVRWVA